MTSEAGADGAQAPRTGRRFFFRSKERVKDVRHIGKNNEVQVFYNNPYADQGSDWVEWAPPALPEPKKKRFEGAAIQVYKKVVENPAVGSNKLYTSEIVLQSPMIREALAEEFEKQGLTYAGDVAKSEHPHAALFFCREKIAEVAKNAEDAVTRSHCTLLCDVIEQHLSDILDAYEDYEKDGLIAYDKLWALFPLGSIFGMQFNDALVALRVEFNWYDSKEKKFIVRGHNVRFDGTAYKLGEVKPGISQYGGKKKLSEGQPDRLVDLTRQPEQRERLRLRGIELLDFQVPRYRQFVPRNVPPQFQNYLKEEDRVVIDSYTHLRILGFFFRDLPATKKPAPQTAQTALSGVASTQANMLGGGSMAQDKTENKLRRPTDSDIQRNKEFMLNDEELLILQSPYISAYSLRRGIWGFVSVENLSPLVLKTSIYDKVVFDEKKKAILRSLAESFLNSKVVYDDLIAGKGQCLLVLLNGEPGTGKTLMVESLAEHLGRPLFRISSAILQDMASPSTTAAPAQTTNNQQTQTPATGATEFEAKMKWASDWGAIVLFDEANFVTERSESAERRSSISVFLRHIEYFKGIVCLTTNVTSSINAALKSRVHIHLTFPSLTSGMRAQIWRNFVDHGSDSTPILQEEDIQRLSQWQMNGRDIKNAFIMARLWCQERGVALTVDAVEDLISLVNPMASKVMVEVENEASETERKHKSAVHDLDSNLLNF